MDFILRVNTLVLILLSLLITFSKGVIHVKFEDVNVEYVNDEYIDEDTFDLSVNYINETYNTLRLKADVTKDFPQNLEVSFRTYAYSLGSFRMPMPGFNYDISTCDLKSKHIYMAPFILAIGGDLNKCAPEKGEYGNESFYPVNISALPNFFPKNKYRHDVKVANNEIDIIKVQFFVEVTY